MNGLRVAIWNPASGGAPAQGELKEALGDGFELVETTEDDPGAGQTNEAVRRGAELVVACGGDGTVRACLDPLARTETALGIVPLGTGNLLASNLGIEPGLDAGKGVGVGTKSTIDLGRVNGEAFSVMAGSGFDALMIRDADDSTKNRFGTVAYVISGAKNLRTNTTHTTVEVDGEQWFQGNTSMVLVGNFGTISGGLEVFPDADPSDGLLDIAVMSANTLREWAVVGWNLVRNRPQPVDLARRTQGRHVIVHVDDARPYELDGETRDPAQRLEFTIELGALTIQQETNS